MANAPNRLDVVQQLAAQFPQEFRDCHRPELGERAFAFVKRVARKLFEENPNFGLNGKRGTNELSMDALSFKTPNSVGEGGVEVIDIVVGAGGDNPQPGWSDATIPGVAGKWIEPPSMGGSQPQQPVASAYIPPPRDKSWKYFDWLNGEIMPGLAGHPLTWEVLDPPEPVGEQLQVLVRKWDWEGISAWVVDRWNAIWQVNPDRSPNDKLQDAMNVVFLEIKAVVENQPIPPWQGTASYVPPPRDWIVLLAEWLEENYGAMTGHPLDVEGVIAWLIDRGPAIYQTAPGGFAEKLAVAKATIEREIFNTVHPPEPKPIPKTAGRLRVEDNRRWLRNDVGRFDYRELTAFSLHSLWRQGQQEYCRNYVREMRRLGSTVLRVIGELDGWYWDRGPDGKAYGDGPRFAGFYESWDPMIDMFADEGMYMRLCFLGGLQGFGAPDGRDDYFSESVREQAEAYVLRLAGQVKDRAHVSGELVNEPIQTGFRNSFDKLIDLGRRVKQIAPSMLLNGGAVDGDNEGDTSFLRAPFDVQDTHLNRLYEVAGYNWVKRSGEDANIDQNVMPYISGEPTNFGEDRADGGGQVDASTAVAFCYGAVSRARKYMPNFHYDGGLWCTMPKPKTLASLQAFNQGLDAFPMLTGDLWRGHHAASFFNRDMYPPEDEPRVVEAHVRAGRGPWRIFGCENYAVSICEPATWNWQSKAASGVQQIARVQYGEFASAVYRR